MIPYLIAHFKGSVLLMALVLVLSISKNDKISNKLKLLLLYVILIKSILPWGIVDSSAMLCLKDHSGGGFSFDLPMDIGKSTAVHIYSTLPWEHLFIYVWAFVSLASIVLCAQGFLVIGDKVNKSFRCSDPVVNDLMLDLSKIDNRKRHIEVRILNTIDTPFVWWNRRWIIVLPKSILALTKMEKNVILAHEFSHIIRNDLIKYFLLKWVKAAFFFSPLVWFVINDILSCEETETDLEAMKRFGITPNDFGRTILRVISMSSLKKVPVPTLIISTKRRLKMRLDGLFYKKRTKKSIWIQGLSALAILMTMMLNFDSGAIADNLPAEGGFIKPVVSDRLTLGFGMKTHPITKKEYRHQGVDLAAKTGTYVLASAKGKVFKADFDDMRGHFLVLQHDKGYTTLYSHLSTILVSKDDMVRQGERIATVGNSGLSTGPHLHFEVRKDNVAINPLTKIQFE